MSWNINQTADVLAGLAYLDQPGSKVVSYGLSALLFSLPCVLAYTSFRRTAQPTAEPSGGDIRVSKLFVHPIKSCRGISVQEAAYTPEGLENDRLWCVADRANNIMLTAREHAKMVLITPSIHFDETCPHKGTLVIEFPEGSECETLRVPLRPNAAVLNQWKTVNDVKLWSSKDIDGYICESLSPQDPSPTEVFSRYLGRDVHLLYKGPRVRRCGPTTAFPDLDASLSYQDGYPLLVLSEESMRSIEEETLHHIGKQGIDERWKSSSLLVERFRPNIVFSGGGPFAEDDWEEITIGNASPSKGVAGFSVVSKCARCLMPNVDTKTGERDPAVPYKVLMKFRLGLEPKEKYKPCVGCNAVPHASGVLRVGDGVIVRKLMK